MMVAVCDFFTSGIAVAAVIIPIVETGDWGKCLRKIKNSSIHHHH